MLTQLKASQQCRQISFMEAAIWVTADGRKRLKRFSGGFSGQNRWVVGGENGVSGVRLELATQRSMKVHDILGTK